MIQRRGAYPPPPGASDIPGLEVSGTIAAVGSGVRQWQCGRSGVRARGRWRLRDDVRGAGARSVFPFRRASTWSPPAPIPETFFTVWTNVFDRGRLRAGETALFHGGTSGIGTTAIQLAAARGARVFATAGSDENVARARTLGAEQAINYRTADFVEAVRELTDGKRSGPVLDMVGGSYVGRNLAALAMDGRLVQIGFMGGESTAQSTSAASWAPPDDHRLDVADREPSRRRARLRRRCGREVWPLLDRGVVKPVIHRMFPLAKAADAHRLMESSEHVGKIVLTD